MEQLHADCLADIICAGSPGIIYSRITRGCICHAGKRGERSIVKLLLVVYVRNTSTVVLYPESWLFPATQSLVRSNRTTLKLTPLFRRVFTPCFIYERWPHYYVEVTRVTSPRVNINHISPDERRVTWKKNIADERKYGQHEKIQCQDISGHVTYGPSISADAQIMFGHVRLQQKPCHPYYATLHIYYVASRIPRIYSSKNLRYWSIYLSFCSHTHAGL